MSKKAHVESLKKYIGLFLTHIATVRRLSEHTVSGYERDLLQFNQFCETSYNESYIDESLLRDYVRYLRGIQVSTKTLHRKFSSIRSLFNYIIEQHRKEGITVNPANEVTLPKAEKVLPKTLDVDQISNLLDTHSKKINADRPGSFIEVRDIAILETFYSSGLRLSELVSLNLDDIDLTEKSIRVTGKGRKQRIVPLGDKAQKAIILWLKSRHEKLSSLQLDTTEHNALFLNRNGKRLSARAVQQRIKKASRLMANAQHVHPHMLRHSFASHLLDSSNDLRAVQELLGHQNLSTTQVYTHLNYQQLFDTYDKAHPKARKKDSTD
jgi:integrase/recombinase XerC